MSDTMFVALMGLAGTLVGSLSGILVANQLVNWRLKSLEAKVDKHNCIIERTYGLEAREVAQDARITALEKKGE